MMPLQVDFLSLDKIEELDKRYGELFLAEKYRDVTDMIQRIDAEIITLQSQFTPSTSAGSYVDQIHRAALSRLQLARKKFTECLNDPDRANQVVREMAILEMDLDKPALAYHARHFSQIMKNVADKKISYQDAIAMLSVGANALADTRLESGLTAAEKLYLATMRQGYEDGLYILTQLDKFADQKLAGMVFNEKMKVARDNPAAWASFLKSKREPLRVAIGLEKPSAGYGVIPENPVAATTDTTTDEDMADFESYRDRLYGKTKAQIAEQFVTIEPQRHPGSAASAQPGQNVSSANQYKDIPTPNLASSISTAVPTAAPVAGRPKLADTNPALTIRKNVIAELNAIANSPTPQHALTMINRYQKNVDTRINKLLQAQSEGKLLSEAETLHLQVLQNVKADVILPLQKSYTALIPQNNQPVDNEVAYAALSEAFESLTKNSDYLADYQPLIATVRSLQSSLPAPRTVLIEQALLARVQKHLRDIEQCPLSDIPARLEKLSSSYDSAVQQLYMLQDLAPVTLSAAHARLLEVDAIVREPLQKAYQAVVVFELTNDKSSQALASARQGIQKEMNYLRDRMQTRPEYGPLYNRLTCFHQEVINLYNFHKPQKPQAVPAQQAPASPTVARPYGVMPSPVESSQVSSPVAQASPLAQNAYQLMPQQTESGRRVPVNPYREVALPKPDAPESNYGAPPKKSPPIRLTRVMKTKHIAQDPVVQAAVVRSAERDNLPPAPATLQRAAEPKPLTKKRSRDDISVSQPAQPPLSPELKRPRSGNSNNVGDVGPSQEQQKRNSGAQVAQSVEAEPPQSTSTSTASTSDWRKAVMHRGVIRQRGAAAPSSVPAEKTNYGVMPTFEEYQAQEEADAQRDKLEGKSTVTTVPVATTAVSSSTASTSVQGLKQSAVSAEGKSAVQSAGVTSAMVSGASTDSPKVATRTIPTPASISAVAGKPVSPLAKAAAAGAKSAIRTQKEDEDVIEQPKLPRAGFKKS